MTLRIKGATTIKGTTTVGFSPATLFMGGIQGVWYDPSDFSTMFQDTAGTTPVTATGQSVARINDKSGNGNNATQSTPANRPTLQQDANGCYYLSFDGSNDYMDFSALAVSNQTLIFGVQPTNPVTAASSSQAILCTISGEVSVISFGSTTATMSNERISWLRVASSVIYGCGQTSEDFAASPYVLTFTYATTPATAYSRNAVSKTLTNTNSSQPGGGAFTATTYPTNYARIGAREDATLFFGGRIYGLIVCGATLTAAQITATENYMNAKTKAY